MLTVAAGVFSGSSFGMPMPAGIDALGRSIDWMLQHGLAKAPRVVAGRDVNVVFGRASGHALPSGTARGAVKAVTIEPAASRLSGGRERAGGFNRARRL
jgi:hypothetical protein